MRTGSQVHVVDGQRGELACSQASLASECQRRPVQTSPSPDMLLAMLIEATSNLLLAQDVEL